MTPEFLSKLQALRMAYGKRRCESPRVTVALKHPIEAKKIKPGAHASGCACDVAVDGQQAHKLLKLAFELGFTGIGVNQKTSGRFIHLDTLTEAPRPNVWSY
jgi:zinc D-Ala-D-Ala carboxypeptidase